MRKLLTAVLFGAAFLSQANAKAPVVLMYQQMAAVDQGDDINVQLASEFADMLGKEGRVSPVVWSQTDPEFRRWQDEKLIPAPKENPTTDEVLKVAKTVGAEYVMILSGIKQKSKVFGGLALYRVPNPKPIWTDAKEFEVLVNNLADWESATLTLANSWTSLLGQGAFSKHKPAVVLPENERKLPPANNPPVKDPEPAPPKVRDTQKVLESVRFLLKQGMSREAVVRLRSGIDSDPLDGVLRQELVSLYISLGEKELAADEAQRFADLSLSNREFLLLSVSMWVELGQPMRAQDLLNELRAREGDSARAKVMQGRIYFALDEGAKGMLAFEEAYKESPTAEAAYGIATVAAMRGQEDNLKQALAQKTPKSEDYEALYRWVLQSIDSRLDMIAAQFRDALQYANGRPGTPEATAKAAKNEALCRSISTLIELLAAPEKHAGSHNRRRLAHKLLVQAAGETLEAAQLGDTDLAAEAALNLGEALKQFPLIKEEFRSEVAGK